MSKLTWKAETRKISQLTAAEYNPRQLTEKQAKDLGESLDKFSLADPIIINSNNTIIGGHQRINVLLTQGVTEVDVRVPSRKLTEDEERELNLRLNKNSGEWDFDKLAEFDVDVLLDVGFEQGELKDIFQIEEEDKDNDAPDVPKKSTSKQGDLYIMGEHRLLCGDSINVDHVERLMDGKKADMMFTDPPYNVAFNGRSGKFDVIKNDDLTDDKFQDFINGFLSIIKIVNPQTYYICCNWKFFGIVEQKLKPKACIVWAKNVFGLGRGYRHQHEFILFDGFIDASIKNESDLWEISKDSEYKHPTQKPVELSERALINSSRTGNICLDLFLGSGSTLIACEKTKRICYGMELDPKYADVIVSRYCEYVGNNKIIRNGKEITWQDQNQT